MIKFFKGIAHEFAYINWPRRRTTAIYTGLIVLVSIFIAYYLGLWDLLFSQGLAKLLAL